MFRRQEMYRLYKMPALESFSQICYFPHIPKLTYLSLILVCRQLFPTNILLQLHIKLENLTTENVLKIWVDEKIFWRLKFCNPNSNKLLNRMHCINILPWYYRAVLRWDGLHAIWQNNINILITHCLNLLLS